VKRGRQKGGHLLAQPVDKQLGHLMRPRTQLQHWHAFGSADQWPPRARSSLSRGTRNTAMSPTSPSSTPGASERERRPPPPPPSARKHLRRVLIGALLIVWIVIAWQFLEALTNSTGSTIAGHPLSNPHTHLHTVVLGDRPGTLYLGTHYGLFISTDGGRTWPQPRGVLNQDMVTTIAVSPSHPDAIVALVLPTSGVSAPSGVAFSSDGGATWQVRVPAGLSPSAYPYTVQAGSGGSGQFYVFYNNAGWFETCDLGVHWYPFKYRFMAVRGSGGSSTTLSRFVPTFVLPPFLALALFAGVEGSLGSHHG
jgi:hypothetical protein